MIAAASTFRPRRTRDDIRGRIAAAKVRAAGGGAMEQAEAHIAASFSEAGKINSHKQAVERMIRMSFGHAEVRARYHHYINLFATYGLSLNVACECLKAERALPRHERTAVPGMIRAELHLILRWLRAKGMHAEFAETVDAVRAGAVHQREFLQAAE